MAFSSFLNRWWNLPYLVMLGLVAVFFTLQALGFALHEGSELDHDHDFDQDHDLDHDQDCDHDAEDDGHWLLGGARVPFMVVWLTLFIFAGFSGIFVNRVLQQKSGGYKPWFFAVSVAVSLAVGVLAVRFVARQVARLVDVGGRGAARRHELEGSIGVVASAELDHGFGEVRVKDGRGNELIVHGHLAKDEPAMRRGARVVLVRLDEGSGLFEVAALEEGRSTSC